MNPKHNQPNSLFQSDIDLLSDLADLAETLKPDPTFQAELEAELQQTHSSNSPQDRPKGANRMKVGFPQLNRRTALVAYALIAIAAALTIPTLISGRSAGWLSAILDSTVDSKANAQTIAQAIETKEITITADAQEYDEATQNVRAIGNVTFTYSEAQIQAKADEARFIPTAQQLMLLGNVQISQRGEQLQGQQFTCSLQQQQCYPSQDLAPSQHQEVSVRVDVTGAVVNPGVYTLSPATPYREERKTHSFRGGI